MRAYFVLCAATAAILSANAAALVAENGPVLSKSFVDKVNRLNGGAWKATYEGSMQNITWREARRLNGVIRNKNGRVLRRGQFTKEEALAPLPEAFDAAEKWPNCPTITQIADQGSCGSCWAVAAATSMSDRFCTIGGVQSLRVSAADLLACCKDCGSGCYGGDPAEAWHYLATRGVSSEYCQPYPFPHCSHGGANSTKYPSCSPWYLNTPKCNSTCTDKTIPVVNYQFGASYSVHGEDSFKRELFFRGPFEVAFDVYRDFLAYKSGVYHHVAGELLGGHAVRLVGWGTADGVPYWKIANSWNEEWGMNGYFLIRRGTNECGIEVDAVSGVPVRSNVKPPRDSHPSDVGKQ